MRMNFGFKLKDEKDDPTRKRKEDFDLLVDINLFLGTS